MRQLEQRLRREVGILPAGGRGAGRPLVLRAVQILYDLSFTA